MQLAEISVSPSGTEKPGHVSSRGSDDGPCLGVVPTCACAGDGELWAQGGGESYCHNDDFPSVLGDRWVEVLSKPGAAARHQRRDTLGLLCCAACCGCVCPSAHTRLSHVPSRLWVVVKGREQIWDADAVPTPPRGGNTASK